MFTNTPCVALLEATKLAGAARGEAEEFQTLL